MARDPPRPPTAGHKGGNRAAKRLTNAIPGSGSGENFLGGARWEFPQRGRAKRLRQIHSAQHGGETDGASAGEVSIFGERLTGLDRTVTYMFQQDALLLRMPWIV